MYVIKQMIKPNVPVLNCTDYRVIDITRPYIYLHSYFHILKLQEAVLISSPPPELTFLAQWWAGCECTIYLENADDEKYIGKEHVIALMNHKYDIDWLMTWLVAERRGMLGVGIHLAPVCAGNNSAQLNMLTFWHSN